MSANAPRRTNMPNRFGYIERRRSLERLTARSSFEVSSRTSIALEHALILGEVIGVKGLDVPIPQQTTAMSCTLNNGIHFVTTPECRLSKDSKIEQEFELCVPFLRTTDQS